MAATFTREQRGGTVKFRYSSNHGQVIDNFKVTSKYLPELMAEVGSRVIEGLRDDARGYSSGTLSYAELRRWRPGRYSTQRGEMADDYLINAQTGRFLSKFSLTRRKTKAGMSYRLKNTTRVGKWILLGLFKSGTARMRRRPLVEKVAEGARPRWRRELNSARMRLLRRWRRSGPPQMKVAK